MQGKHGWDAQVSIDERQKNHMMRPFHKRHFWQEL